MSDGWLTQLSLQDVLFVFEGTTYKMTLIFDDCILTVQNKELRQISGRINNTIVQSSDQSFPQTIPWRKLCGELFELKKTMVAGIVPINYRLTEVKIGREHQMSFSFTSK